jgi:hypothetical protein
MPEYALTEAARSSGHRESLRQLSFKHAGLLYWAGDQRFARGLVMANDRNDPGHFPKKYTREETAEILGMSVATLDRERRDGRILP